MSIISDSYNPLSVILTATQKAILAVVHNAPTPETAFEAINGSPELVTARNILERLGLISLEGIRAELTGSGKQAAIANNIFDTSGTLTEEGEALVASINVAGGRSVVENFELLKSII